MKKHSEGTSFIPLVRNEQFDAPPVFVEFGNWISIRDKDWKLTVNREALTPTHLFNLAEDPLEMKNMVNKATEQQDKLRAQIKSWWEHVNTTQR